MHRETGDRPETARRPPGDRLETARRPPGDRLETARRPPDRRRPPETAQRLPVVAGRPPVDHRRCTDNIKIERFSEFHEVPWELWHFQMKAC
jgi:hypothetical protein